MRNVAIHKLVALCRNYLFNAADTWKLFIPPGIQICLLHFLCPFDGTGADIWRCDAAGYLFDSPYLQQVLPFYHNINR
jgi:hypothetical protein